MAKSITMKIRELDEFLETIESIGDFFVLDEDEEHREVVEGDYVYIPKLGINIHVAYWEYREDKDNEFETDFDYYVFFCAATNEYIYSEQGSAFVVCIHNFAGLEWDQIMELECQYVFQDDDYEEERSRE